MPDSLKKDDLKSILYPTLINDGSFFGRRLQPNRVTKLVKSELVKKDNYRIIFDRREAIKEALDMIENEDVVLILGKGHEDYQILGHEKVHLDDAEEVRKYLENSY